MTDRCDILLIWLFAEPVVLRKGRGRDWAFTRLSIEVPTVIRTLQGNNGKFKLKAASEARKQAVFVDYRQIITRYFCVIPGNCVVPDMTKVDYNVIYQSAVEQQEHFVLINKDIHEGQ